MKKLLSLLLMVLFVFFTNVKIAAIGEKPEPKSIIEQVVQSHVIVNKITDIKEVFKGKILTIIQNKISMDFDYVYNKFVIKRSNTMCMLESHSIQKITDGVDKRLKISHLLQNSRPRSDKKNKMGIHIAIRGPCVYCKS